MGRLRDTWNWGYTSVYTPLCIKKYMGRVQGYRATGLASGSENFRWRATWRAPLHKAYMGSPGVHKGYVSLIWWKLAMRIMGVEFERQAWGLPAKA